MYIALEIGSEQRVWSSITETWIRDQLDRRRRDGQGVCVRLIVKGDNVDIALGTAACGGSGGGRQPRPVESRILEIWREAHLNGSDFSAGNVYAMLRRVHQVVD